MMFDSSDEVLIKYEMRKILSLQNVVGKDLKGKVMLWLKVFANNFGT